MRLSSFSGQVNQNLTEGTVESTSSMEQGLKNGMEAVAGKLPGQSVSGEVLLRNGSDILISMGKNQLLQAKLEGNMSAQPGQMLTFQIKHNSSSKIVLTPLFENTSQDPNVSKALMAAGLPENSITAGMVRAMMQEGLSINRQSLFQMNRLINANPQTDIQTLVQMQRLSLPVTPENIAQFEAYKNYQHQLGESLSDIAEAFTQTFQEITGSGNMEEGLGFYKEVLGILAGEAEEGTVQDAVKAPVQGQENGQVQQMQGDVPKLGAVLGEAAEGELVKDTSAKEAPAKSGMPQALPDAMPELSKEETAELARQLKQAGFPRNLTNAVLTGQISGRKLLGEVEKRLSDENIPDREALYKLLEGKEFKHLLKNEMTRQWMLTPEEVAKEGSVDKLYERLNSQLNRLNQVLSQTGKENTPLAKTISNTTSNIDFMNQMNQMFTYVQLPLKMQGKNANGELFVYTNKKSLAKKDGSVSALLHLDMEHLGSVDVHVTLNNQKVSTKFYLKDDSVLDFIAQNIDKLNKRLESRGYSATAEFINKEEDTNVMEEILKQDKNISMLSGYSFDARA
ncbi:hypothetical protein IMSAG249_00307 [Lachnospiraceae bacterium]|jgi:hypothetical protein|nr:flagellar hook-length control protein FliK [Lachnospiraceae bacterium]GFI68490.1 hypothetical protein IMSAG249_00307 [Lachnospiraceae bacterium]